MNSPTTLSYPRAPSENLQNLLSKKFLAPLLNLNGMEVSDCKLDVHFRSGDEIHVYYGSARIINAKHKVGGVVSIGSDKKYRGTEYKGNLFREWSEDKTQFADELNIYLEYVNASGRQVIAEDRVQDSWSRCTFPWISIDREVAFEGGSREKNHPEVQKALDLARNIAHRPNRYGESWEKPKTPTGKQLDRLGIDEQGHLVLAELKHASSKNFSSIFYAPLQLLAYVHEWHQALKYENINQQLQKLICARKRLDLSREVAPLTKRIRPAICFGKDDRSKEVKRRYYEVLGVSNAHLPENVGPIETWMIGDDGKPRPL